LNNFPRGAAVGQSEDYPIRSKNASLAMRGFGRVHEVRRAARGTKDSRDLVGDQTALADPGNRDAASIEHSFAEKRDGLLKWSPHRAVEAGG